MSDRLTQRLNAIMPKLLSDEFLNGGGIGNEIGFYIFEYPPQEELRVREHIAILLDHLPKKKARSAGKAHQFAGFAGGLSQGP